MQRPTISVIITNFNYAGFLPRSVTSVLAQDYDGPVQTIVVDDKSTDNSAEIIASFGDRITAVMKPENAGHGAAFNSGFAASNGEIVLFLDADDYFYPHAISTLVATIRPDAAQYQYRLDVVDGGGAKVDIYPPAESAMEEGDVKAQLSKRGKFGTTVTSGLAFPRWCLEKILPMPPEDFRQGGDGFLVTVAPLYGQVVNVPGLLAAYCQHGANHSQFELDVAKRARWRLYHDEMRYKALRAHAAKIDLSIAEEPGLRDLDHLTERLASVQLEPGLHPYPGDTASKLAPHGFRTLKEAPMSAKRRSVMAAWWWFASHAPRKAASPAITWKLAANSRPKVIDRVAKFIRRLSRPSRSPIDALPGEPSTSTSRKT